MNQFKIVPISKEYASNIRETKVDDFGHKIIEQVATGVGSCRVSLQPFVPGKDKRILLSYSPFTIDNAFNQLGPIFIHKKDVKPYASVYQFPPKIKADKQNFPITLIGYNEKQEMICTRLVGDKDIDVLIAEIFNSDPEISYLHARNAEAGCYICRIERV
ncbi:DUF1203 domain-containing protein [Aquimarina sp. AU474]|uniref:DUF1203 domain-containing protein n=1 Tax=Aquimarina sp. AU474 TaxID=2108529 RepID=UPI000D69EA80|nr:DUF1203 domain-containing protein [Aquimarina sp. AU474]